MYITEDTNICSSNTRVSLKILSYDNNRVLVDYIIPNYDYLKETNEVVRTEYKHEKYSDVALTTTDLNFRSSPSNEVKIIITLMKNIELEVIAKVLVHR